MEIKDLIDETHHVYWRDAVAYVVNPNEELLEKIKKFEDDRNIWDFKDVAVSPQINDLILGHKNTESFQTNVHGFAPINQKETRALRSANSVLLTLCQRDDLESMYYYSIFLDRLLDTIKQMPVHRDFLINVIRCLFEHILKDRVGLPKIA